MKYNLLDIFLHTKWPDDLFLLGCYSESVIELLLYMVIISIVLLLSCFEIDPAIVIVIGP